MSRLSNLLQQVETQDPQLAADLKREVEALSGRRAFGLNFERHIPETVELPHRPVRRGDKVRFLPERGEKPSSVHRRLWRVGRIRRTDEGRVADLVRDQAPEAERQTAIRAVDDLVVVAEFRDPIYPGLVSTGKVERGGAGDEEFKREFVVRDLYNFPRRSYWLRRLENDGRKERVPVDEYTIEHILPQNENLSAKWRDELGPDWHRVQETWLHTLGNLTLTGYNAEYSDRPFPDKRDMKGGFRESPLKLNEGLSGLDKWDEAAIKNRAERLAAVAAVVWAVPSLQAEVLELYRTRGEKAAGYTIHDHPQLAIGSPMRELFEIFRKEVLALDPCVSEEFLKLYVAYKAETNFVDIVPQKARLRLSLNMQFHELHDPKGLAKDVTSLGRWGNGDVEVGFRKPEELPYVMGLVRQALEKQMGNGEAEA